MLHRIIQPVTMDDWVCDVVFTCKGKEYKRTISSLATLSEEAAMQCVRYSLISGRRTLPEDHWAARPAITITDMKMYRRHNHPRHRKDTDPQVVSDRLEAVERLT